MNRLFNKGRKYKVLSVLMALAMLFSLLPTNIVKAEAQTVATATALEAESGNGFMNDTTATGKVVYDPNGEAPGKLRARVEFPTTYEIKAGDVVTINYETNISSMTTGIGYDYNGKENITLTSDKTSVTYTVTEEDVTYYTSGSAGQYPVAMRFKQSGCAEDSYLAVSSVTVTRDVTTGGDDPNSGDDPNGGDDNTGGGSSEGGTEGVIPTVTINAVPGFYTNVSEAYPNDVMAMKYTQTTKWNVVETSIGGVDLTKYTGIEVEVTSSREGMEFAIADKNWNTLCSEVMASGTQTYTLNYNTDENGSNGAPYDPSVLYFYFDTATLDYVSDVELTAVVNSVKFIGEKASVEPGNPDGGDTPPSGDDNGNDGVIDYITNFYCEGSTGFVMNAETGRAEYSTGTLRGRIDFTDGIVVEEGDILTINYATNMTDVKAVLAYAYTDKITMSSALPSSETETTFTYTLDAAAVAFFNDASNSGEDIRFKSSSGAAGQYFAVSSVTITRELPVEQPTVTIDTTSEGYIFNDNGDGYDVTYTAGSGYYTINVAISNPDPATFTTLLIDLTPIANMNMGIVDNGGTTYRDHWGKGVFTTADRTTLEYTLAANSTGFVIYCDAANPTLTGTQTFKLHSIKVVDPTALEPKPEPVIPSWQVNNGPKVTLNTDNSVFACKVNDDKSVDVSFTAYTGWTALRADVENCDYTKYPRVKIDITPAEGLYLYVYGDAKSDISGKKEFEDTKRTTIEFDLKANTTYFDIWCNPEAGKGTAGLKNFTIHSIKIVDPTIPEGEWVDTVLDVESGNFVIDEQGRLYTASANKLRGMLEFPEDFRVEAGKALYIGYETNMDSVAADFTYGNGSGAVVDTKMFNSDEKLIQIVIDEKWVNYFAGNTNYASASTRARIKLDSAPAESYLAIKYVIYGDAIAEKYDPNQVPQGLVVTYYNDIYSRGVAWNTDDTVTENALYVVKATGDMTAETVVWTKEGTDGALVPADGVQVIDASSTCKKTVDEVNKTWHTFKAHVENLTPGATYFYRAGNETTGWSEVGSFKVEKAANEIDSYSFIHVTDSQEEDEAGFMQWARVLKAAYEASPNAAFVAHTGDLVNNSAENSTAAHMMEWIYCFDVPMAQIMNGVLAPACGNHDCFKYAFTDRFDIEWADYKKETTGTVIDEETGEIIYDYAYDHLDGGGCYTVTYGAPGEDNNGLVLITLANTEEAWSYDTDFKVYQMKWLEEQLKTHKEYKWKVVQMHEGIMTAGDHTTDGEVDQMRDGLPPIFAKYEVDLVLQGHDHVYTRTRSYAYGEDVFEEDGSYFDGHTPIWTKTVQLEPGEKTKDGKVENTLDRTIYLEPNGTHYITINSCGTKQYPEEPAENIDEVIFEGDNPLNPTDENGNWGSMCQTGFPMYGIVTVEDDFLIYDSYIYDNGTRKGELYDTFAVSKNYIAGYDTENPNDGKTKVFLYGIKVETKTYNGIAPRLDITGFNASNPEIMDYATFKYTITGTTDAQQSYSQSGKGDLFYGSNGKGIIPTEKGLYTLTVEIPANHRYYYGSLSTTFAIN